MNLVDRLKYYCEHLYFAAWCTNKSMRRTHLFRSSGVRTPLCDEHICFAAQVYEHLCFAAINVDAEENSLVLQLPFYVKLYNSGLLFSLRLKHFSLAFVKK